MRLKHTPIDYWLNLWVDPTPCPGVSLDKYKLVSRHLVTYVASKGPIEHRFSLRHRTVGFLFWVKHYTDIILEGWQEWEFCTVPVEVYARLHWWKFWEWFTPCPKFGVIKRPGEVRWKEWLKISEKKVGYIEGRLEFDSEKVKDKLKELAEKLLGALVPKLPK